MRDWWRRSLTRELTRLRNDGRAALLWSLRITVAAVASYVVGTLFFPGTQPLLAPLTAMLVVQVTPVSLLASGLDRVVAVISGVSLAVAFSAVVPLEWWSLGLLILVSITIGQVLRLRSNLIEVAISGMLVLGVGSLGAESAAWQRLAETLVGAAVGIAANLLLPPKVASGDAGRAIDGLADSVSELLNRAADELTALVGDGHDLAPVARGWLGEARRITYDIPRIGAALLHAEQGRRLNVRAVGTPNVGPGLRQGLEALEHSSVAIRGMFRALVDATYDATWIDDERAEDTFLGLAQTFRELAAAVDAFGQLVRDESVPTKRMSPTDVHTLRGALEGLHEARARLEELVMADTPPELLELQAAVLSTVKRLQREIDLDERIRRQLRLRPPPHPRRPHRNTAPPGNRPSAPPEPSPEAETQLLPKLPDDRDKRHR
ncbi:MAG TPA: FUSC family protein [Nocardioidaceae bacterium]|nr:FUSC family protein [Nocardioidaceae bacterium]